MVSIYFWMEKETLTDIISIQQNPIAHYYRCQLRLKEKEWSTWDFKESKFEVSFSLQFLVGARWTFGQDDKLRSSRNGSINNSQQRKCKSLDNFQTPLSLTTCSSLQDKATKWHSLPRSCLRKSSFLKSVEGKWTSALLGHHRYLIHR